MPVLNVAKGVDNFGDEEVYWDMVKQFEKLTMDQTVNKVYESMKARDFMGVRSGAHQLKGASGYIGADDFNTACLILHKAIDDMKAHPCEDDDKIILQTYLDFMIEAKKLKAYLGEVLKKEVDLTPFEQYICEFTSKETTVNNKAKEDHSLGVKESDKLILTTHEGTEAVMAARTSDEAKAAAAESHYDENDLPGIKLEDKPKDEPCKCACVIFQRDRFHQHSIQRNIHSSVE
eukprot:TRINITY_DN7218_c0_g2_i1.p1 TRINITY_DN7218_c0_g2~~TRINITY_DN7218_c0_g2_i1.p1  ORF type:complete len:233 (+),score=43.34 TRINITY_DN7218_c0_g2_i1:189-887(+)